VVRESRILMGDGMRVAQASVIGQRNVMAVQVRRGSIRLRSCATWVTAVLMVLTTVLCGASAASAADLISVVGGTKRTLGSANEVVFPVDLTEIGKADGDVTETVIEVLRRTLPVSVDAVSVELDKSGGRLRVSIRDDDALAPAADYTVTVLLEDKSGNRQSVSLTLSRPAGELITGGTVEVEDVDEIGFLDKLGLGDLQADSYPPLELGVARGAPITQLTARQLERGRGSVMLTIDCAEGDEPCKGCELSTSEPLGINPPASGDGVLTLGYDLADFPIGTTTRTVELRSPQLAAPVTLTFTVKRIRSALWIPILCLLGLATGLLLRNVLAQIISRAQLERARLDLREKAAGLRHRYSDDTLKEELGRIEDEANRADLKAIIALQEDMAKALKAANERIAMLKEDRDALATAVAGVWSLPKQATETLTKMRSAIGALSNYLKLLHTEEAAGEANEVDSLVAQLSEECSEFSQHYRTALTKAKAELAPHAAGWPVDRAAGALDQAIGLTDDAWPGELRGQLNRTRALVQDWQRDVLPSLQTLADHRADARPGEAQAVRDALSEGDPDKQLSKAADHLAALAAPLVPAATGSVAAGAARDDLPLPALTNETDISIPQYDLPLLEELRLRADAGFQILLGRLASALTLLILAVIVSALSWAVAENDWTGTPAQLSAIFVWAFVTDLTVQAVRAAFGAASATPPTLE